MQITLRSLPGATASPVIAAPERVRIGAVPLVVLVRSIAAKVARDVIALTRHKSDILHSSSLERLLIQYRERLLDIFVLRAVNSSLAEVLPTIGVARDDLTVVLLDHSVVVIVYSFVVAVGPLLDSDVVATIVVSSVSAAALEVLSRHRAVRVTVDAVVLDLGRVTIVKDVNVVNVVAVFLRVAPANRDADAATLVLIHALGLQVDELDLAHQRVRRFTLIVNLKSRLVLVIESGASLLV